MREVSQGFPLPAKAPKPCPICGKPAVMMIGGPCLCPDHLEQQRPLIGPWWDELLQLIQKHLDSGLYKGYVYRDLNFLCSSSLDINDILKANEEKDIDTE